jgi:hypothetical protein
MPVPPKKEEKKRKKEEENRRKKRKEERRERKRGIRRMKLEITPMYGKGKESQFHFGNSHVKIPQVVTET